jgi:hypothetical protein
MLRSRHVIVGIVLSQPAMETAPDVEMATTSNSGFGVERGGFTSLCLSTSRPQVPAWLLGVLQVNLLAGECSSLRRERPCGGGRTWDLANVEMSRFSLLLLLLLQLPGRLLSLEVRDCCFAY